jgi:hypothetical protein
MKDTEFLNWLHDRLITHHGENRNYDYMHRLREIIAKMEAKGMFPLMTQEDVAEALGLPVKRLKNWRENNTGGPRWLKLANGHVRYRREDVETWMLTRLRVPTVGKDDG